MNSFVIRSWLARGLLFAFSVVIAASFVTPLLWLITAPFNTQANLAVTIPTNPSLANFEAVYHNKFAMRALFQNNLIIGGGVMVLVAGVATMASYGLSRTHVPGRDVLVYVLILFSSVVSGTAAMVPIFLLVFRLGLIDTYAGVILVMTGGLLPSAIFIMRDFIDSIPRSYEEAALVCGASSLRVFRDVALPMVRPGVVVVAIWAFVNAWGAFLIPSVLLRSPDRMPASIASYSFYTEAGTPNLTLLSAYAFLYTIPVLVLYLIVNWRFGFRFFGGIKS
ncbi:MAG: carbohydrate ABC transporter permease [Anaerolineae bacterium]|nr:carbohydrate ABC transporter permease [Anaerolineae bacterium]MEB2288891.1 carbohydrate ABC transporter permease [Anaerolineae bacterium]